MSRLSVLLSIIMALGSALLIDAVYHGNSVPIAPNGETHQLFNLQVLGLGLDKFHYEFRDEKGIVFWAHFCTDYEPQFSAGMTLNVLTYQDMGECWSVLNTHPAYLIKRDKHGKIVKEDFYVRPEEASAAR